MEIKVIFSTIRVNTVCLLQPYIFHLCIDFILASILSFFLSHPIKWKLHTSSYGVISGCIVLLLCSITVRASYKLITKKTYCMQKVNNNKKTLNKERGRERESKKSSAHRTLYRLCHECEISLFKLYNLPTVCVHFTKINSTRAA